MENYSERSQPANGAAAAGRMGGTAVVVFLKAPRLGLVKTRLARSVGEVRALEIYRALAQQQLAALPEAWARWVSFTPADAAAEVRAWVGEGVTLLAQPPGELGERLHAGFRAAFAAGASRALVVGADCPALDRARLEAAERCLATHDAVLGPASDGGFYLLGLRASDPELLRGIAWGTEEVAAQTRQRLRERRWAVAELPVATDVDDAASLQAVLAAGEFRLPESA